MICFSLTDEQSFKNVEKWIASMKEHCNDDTKRIIVGNKADLVDERVVTREMAERVAKANNTKYFEVSALQNKGVAEAFENLMVQVDGKGQEVQSRETLVLTSNSNQEKKAERKKCCK